MSKHKIHQEKEACKKDITVIIPAAGAGRRMKSYGPKSLIKIKRNKSILDNQIQVINNAFASSQIILVCGFEATKLMNETCDDLIKVENELYDSTNVVRSIGMGLRATDSNSVLILYGDLVLNQQTLDSLDYNTSCISVSDKHMGEEEVGCIINDKGYLEHMMYDLPKKWNQILYLTGKELEKFKKISWDTKNKTIFGFEAINKLIQSDNKIKCIDDPKAIVIDIDTSKDLERAKGII